MLTYKLSYVITTFNKIEYLKITLPELILNCKVDEEIVVIDGGSKDGTKEFLEKLHHEKKIHQFMSEPDFGEAHGFNKGFLMARGELIKIITDDDVFYFEGIQACKKKMLANPEIDLMVGNIATLCLNKDLKINLRIDDLYYEKWKDNEIPSFWFHGQPVMFRRNKLPIIGFYNTDYIVVDTEFSLRITKARKVSIDWTTDILAINIQNTDSNSLKFNNKIIQEVKSLQIIYSARLNEIINNDEKNPVFLFLKSLKNVLKYISIKLIGSKPKIDKNTTFYKTFNYPFKTKEFTFANIYLELKNALTEINKNGNFKIESI
jgi:glycosyltransferase involved in cell wall biosynthesis